MLIITVNTEPGEVITWNGWIFNRYMCYQRTSVCPDEEAGFYSMLTNYIFI